MDDRDLDIRCSCGHSFEVAPSMAGHEVSCPACGGKSVAPPRAAPPSQGAAATKIPPLLKSGTARRSVPGAPADSAAHAEIPGYRFLKRLGSGGMGDVFLARQESLDRPVAIKLLPPEFARDRGYVEHFLKEARSAAKLSHPNIVGAYDCGESGGRSYFVMEYVAGETLHKLIKQPHAIPEARALDIARQIARGLQHAQRHGLIHRDVKPKNILITPEGTAKICDFGLARELKAADNPSEEDLLHSTPAYASPEQCRGEANLDHRTDIYSLGVSLFETLTGRRPFTGERSKEIMLKHVTEEPPDPRSLNPALSEAAGRLVLKMLRKRREDRFQTYDELLAAIDAIARPAGTQRKLAEPKPFPFPGGKNGLGIAAGSAAAVIVVVLLVVLARGRHAPPPPAAAATAPAGPERDPEMERLLAEAQGLEQGAEGRPAEYSAVRARWKALEERYGGTPHYSLIHRRLMEFEDRVKIEADRLGGQAVREANENMKLGRPADAILALRKFPPEFGGTDAGGRVAERTREIERSLDEAFREGIQGVVELVSAEKYDEARRQLNALKPTISYLGPRGLEYARSAHRGQIESLQKRIDEEELLAKKRAAEGPARTPASKPVAPPPPPGPAPPPGPPAKPVAPSATAAPHFAILRDAAERADPAKRSAAAAFFAANAPKSWFARAVAMFLSRDDKAWRLEGATAPALAEYLNHPALANPDAVTPDQHPQLFAFLAEKIAGLGGAPADALQFFACAHAEEILAGKGRIDAAVSLPARIGKAPVSDIWGPIAGVTRVEMARFLQRPAGLWLARAADGASAAPDFATRYLGAICVLKEASVDIASAADRWKKLGASAPDAAWSKFGEGVAERLRQGAACEACLGLGRYTCPSCGGQGFGPCATCGGTGGVTDPATLVRKNCGTCQGRRNGPCAGCGGKQNLKCVVCEGKKSRTTLPGGPFRSLIELGRCDGCGGSGSLFPTAAYPCPRCDGNGRILENVVKDYLRFPAWTKTREGRIVTDSLRWLVRHQSPQGFWDAASWASMCKDEGCGKPAPPVPGVSSPFEVGETSLTLLAFLGAGAGPESDLPLGGVTAGEIVKRALAWLISCQKPDGLIAQGASIKPMYEHLLATYALCAAFLTAGESYGERERATLREAALRAARAALAGQQKGAGWGYTVPSTASDSWVTAWGAMALLAAREAGLEAPRANLDAILSWYTLVTDKADLRVAYTSSPATKVSLPGAANFAHHETLSAAGGLVRILIEAKSTTPVAAAERFLRTDLPGGDPAKRDYAYWYWGTAFLAHREQRKGTPWQQWSQAAIRETALLQETGDTCALGSWPSNDRWSSAGGKVYATAMNALTLEYASGLRPLMSAKSK